VERAEALCLEIKLDTSRTWHDSGTACVSRSPASLSQTPRLQFPPLGTESLASASPPSSACGESPWQATCLSVVVVLIYRIQIMHCASQTKSRAAFYDFVGTCTTQLGLGSDPRVASGQVGLTGFEHARKAMCVCVTHAAHVHT
jgi:hypothetical protein